MLPAAFRLRRSEDITRVLRQGASIFTPHVRIHALLKPEQGRSRLMGIVSKKVHRSAVQRHKYQRWIRVYLAELVKELHSSYDIVLVARPSITSLAKLTQFTATLEDIPNQLDKYPL